LCSLVLAPDLLSFDAENLHPKASWCGNIVGHDLGSERRVSHDDIVFSRLREHALREVRREVTVDFEFANNTLLMVNGHVLRVGVESYALSLQMSSSQAVMVFIEVHHLHTTELL
jgi:hypothetical protein